MFKEDKRKEITWFTKCFLQPNWIGWEFRDEFRKEGVYIVKTNSKVILAKFFMRIAYCMWVI